MLRPRATMNTKWHRNIFDTQLRRSEFHALGWANELLSSLEEIYMPMLDNRVVRRLVLCVR